MIGKKWKILLQIAMFGCMMGSVIGLSGCSAKGGTLSEKEIREALNTLECYQAEVRITFYSNKGENVYELLQQADQLGRYRMEILTPDTYKGITTICDGENVLQVDPDTGASVSAKESPIRSNLMLFGFLKAFAADDNPHMEWLPGSEEVMMTANLSENHGIRKMELTLDTRAAIPRMLDLKDAQGQLLIRIEYQSFEGNTELPESLFETK